MTPTSSVAASSMDKNPILYVSRQHPEFPYVTEKTRLYVVGSGALSITHQCKTGGVTGFETPSRTSIVLSMFAPSLGSNRTAYCRVCDTLYVGEEANRHGG